MILLQKTRSKATLRGRATLGRTSLPTSCFSFTSPGAVGTPLQRSLSGSFAQSCGRSLIFPYIYAGWMHPSSPTAAETVPTQAAWRAFSPPAVTAHCVLSRERGDGCSSEKTNKKKKTSPTNLHFIKRNKCFQC